MPVESVPSVADAERSTFLKKFGPKKEFITKKERKTLLWSGQIMI
ncbi:hypothetical protein [Salibacterium salarium]|nr:hypothetical protein [Salibacterium salarium]